MLSEHNANTSCKLTMNVVTELYTPVDTVYTPLDAVSLYTRETTSELYINSIQACSEVLGIPVSWVLYLRYTCTVSRLWLREFSTQGTIVCFLRLLLIWTRHYLNLSSIKSLGWKQNIQKRNGSKNISLYKFNVVSVTALN